MHVDVDVDITNKQDKAGETYWAKIGIKHRLHLAFSQVKVYVGIASHRTGFLPDAQLDSAKVIFPVEEIAPIILN